MGPSNKYYEIFSKYIKPLQAAGMSTDNVHGWEVVVMNRYRIVALVSRYVS